MFSVKDKRFRLMKRNKMYTNQEAAEEQLNAF
jgi:hypothetical protein